MQTLDDSWTNHNCHHFYQYLFITVSLELFIGLLLQNTLKIYIDILII